MGRETDEELRKGAERAFAASPPPILLTKADALEFAAQCLDSNAKHLSLVTTLLNIVKGSPADAALLANLRQRAVEPDLQIAAMKSAAGSIRELALEERLVAARAAQQQDRKR